MTPQVLFHQDCPDGYGSAWLLGMALGEHTKHPCRYSNPPPAITPGADVYVCDFAFPAADLNAIAATAATVRVMDHHETSLAWLREAEQYTICQNIEQWETEGFGGDEPRCWAIHDQKHSGVGIVAAYVAVHYNIHAPAWFANLEDRDLWTHRHSATPAIFAAITSRPYTEEAWAEMAEMLPVDLRREGEGIERYRQQLVTQIVDTAYETVIGGHTVWVAAAPYAVASEVAGTLAARNPDLFGAYFVPYGDRIKFGLRSTEQGLNVAAFAERWPGGGGHPRAAGFTVDEWEDIESAPACA